MCVTLKPDASKLCKLFTRMMSPQLRNMYTNVKLFLHYNKNMYTNH